MKAMLALILISMFGVLTVFARHVTRYGSTYDPETDSPYTCETSYCIGNSLEVIERVYEQTMNPLVFDYDGRKRFFGLYLQQEGVDGKYQRTLLAALPETYDDVTHAFECYRCIDGHWSWRLTLSDSTGLTLATINRECNERLHIVCNDLQINLPEEVQEVKRRREPVGDME